MTSGAMVTPVVVMGTRGDLRKTRYPFFYFIRAIIIPSSPAGNQLEICKILNKFFRFKFFKYFNIKKNIYSNQLYVIKDDFAYRPYREERNLGYDKL